MEKKDGNSRDLLPSERSNLETSRPAASTGSTMPLLMERINRILGKNTEICPSNEGTSETETDDDSDIDDNVSLLECAKSCSSPRLGFDGSDIKRSRCGSSLINSSKSTHTKKAKKGPYKHLGTSASFTGRHLEMPLINEPVVVFDDCDFPVVSTRTVSHNKAIGDYQDLQMCKKKWNEEVQSIHPVADDSLQKPLISHKNMMAPICSQTLSVDSDKTGKEREKENKRRAREIAKQAKESAKQNEKKKKLEEKEAKKRKLEQDKNVKKAELMTAKADSIDQCLKHVTAVLDNAILTDGGGAILHGLESLGVQYEVKKMPVGSTVGWMRNRIEYAAAENGQIINRNSSYEEEEQVLIKIDAPDFAKMIQSQNTNDPKASTDTIHSYVANAERLLPNKKVTAIVTGMDSYFKTVKAKSALERKKGSTPSISKTELEDVLLQLEVQSNCCVHFCENADAVAQMVCSFTKSVAEKPYKKTCGVAFNIYMNNHEKGLPRVTKDGQGLLEVWLRQLQQFKGVGYDTAAAIVQKYPSPSMLVKEYEKCRSNLEASFLLQDIEVRRGHGVLATSRRVGPELSKRIHTLLMSSDGTTELAKS